ncbi:BRO family, N-terminal domain [Anaerovirgula multivorans]|uniref:BRO family, N-terminal domain n=1 Tax=Anaerovirgula multivorans TaxID=312168 RepID=A0A238ZQV2_9FIRM|nr:BRO family protein [Anaerovirgula multivorans]SNR85569.1 BRO family, N-terminal domain [Anaerovirgula multivorans]
MKHGRRLTKKQIGRALDYSDAQKAIDNLHKRHKERLDKFSVTLKLRGTDGKEYNTTVYSPKGLYEICRWSRQPKADAFMDWVWDIIESLRKPIKLAPPNPAWYIKWYKGLPIVTLHDFKVLTGLDLHGMEPFFRLKHFTPAVDYNGLGQGPLRQEFERVNNVHYEEETFIYMYASGVKKALRILANDRKLNMSLAAVSKSITDSLCQAERTVKGKETGGTRGGINKITVLREKVEGRCSSESIDN